MKKTIIFTLLLILLVSGVLAQLQAEIIVPTGDKIIGVGESLAYLGLAHSGQTPYTYLWTFCGANCTPLNSDQASIAQVNYTDIGTHTVTFQVTDFVSTIATDTIEVDVRLAKINYPENNSYIFKYETIDFEGSAMKAGGGTFTYSWDFGNAWTNSYFAGQRIVEDPVGIAYPGEGTYTVTFQVTDQSTGMQQTDSIQLNILETLNFTIGCTTRLTTTGCEADEEAMMQMSHSTNAHARSIYDLYIYDYIVCCKAEVLMVDNITNANSPSVFAVLTNDNPSLIGGEHKTIDDTPPVWIFSLESYEGAGTLCQDVNIGANSNCPAGTECVYEFYPGESASTTAHIAICTGAAPNAYGASTHAMCCGIMEDCRNNLDDDQNIWFDCVDRSVCTVPGAERVCAISDNFKHNPTCSWLSAYCDPSTGECDFTDYTSPNWENAFNTYSYALPSPGFELCTIIYLGGSWQAFNCPPGTNQNDIVLPPTADAAAATVNAQYAPLNTDGYELYAMCRLFYCSNGKAGDLPAYLPDMENDSYLTRHCCPTETYWDPEAQACLDFSECYSTDPTAGPCNYDFNTEFLNWSSDVFNATNPIWDPEDCVIEQELEIENTNEVLCCPVWQGGDNIYTYSDISYYVQV